MSPAPDVASCPQQVRASGDGRAGVVMHVTTQLGQGGSVCVSFNTSLSVISSSLASPPRKQNKALRGNVEMAAAISKVHQINTWMDPVSRAESSKLTSERGTRDDVKICSVIL